MITKMHFLRRNRLSLIIKYLVGLSKKYGISIKKGEVKYMFLIRRLAMFISRCDNWDHLLVPQPPLILSNKYFIRKLKPPCSLASRKIAFPPLFVVLKCFFRKFKTNLLVFFTTHFLE